MSKTQFSYPFGKTAATVLVSAILCFNLMPQETFGASSALKELENDFITIAKDSSPAVVSIQVKTKNKFGFRQGDTYQFNSPLDMFNDDLLRRFFGNQQPNEKPMIGQGSGFLVSTDGLILTNNHVVQDTSEINVILNDGREFPGKVIGKDPNTDVALIKIDSKNLPFLTLGDSSQLEVGQWVAAIGNPFGLQASFTVGVVSAKGRNNLDIARIEDFIQTDAAINQGNSGGPLINLNGKVIGINTAIATNSGGYMGIGFAIPSNIAKQIMDQLLSTGKVSRGYIGVSLQRVDNDLAHAFDLPKPEGALIADIIKGSPAEKAGLKHGDIILKYNNQTIENIGSFRNAIALMQPGSKVTLQVLRDKKNVDIPIIIGVFQDGADNVIGAANNILGLEVTNLTSDIAQKLGLQDPQGVVITHVDPNGTGALAGLKKGGIVVSVNKTPITSVEQFNSLIGETEAGRPILLLVKQDDGMRFVSIRKKL